MTTVQAVRAHVATSLTRSFLLTMIKNIDAQVEVEVWTNDRCKSSYGSSAPGGITSHMLCASLPNQDSCSVSMHQISIKTPNPKWPVKVLGVRYLSVCGPLHYPILPPLHTEYVCTVNLFTQGRGEGGELTREKVRGARASQSRSKIPTWLTVSLVYKLY
jgi:hypothetical protein